MTDQPSDERELRRVIRELDEETAKWDIIANDPESEALVDRLAEVIAEELEVQLVLGEWRVTEDQVGGIADMVAEHVLSNFTVRARRWQDRFTLRPKGPRAPGPSN